MSERATETATDTPAARVARGAKPTVLYVVSTWDHDKQGWSAYATRVGKWGLRKTLGTLYGRGYGKPSILLERRDGDSSGMRDRSCRPPAPVIHRFPGTTCLNPQPSTTGANP